MVLKIIFFCFLMFVTCTGGAEYNNSMSRSFKGSTCYLATDCHELLGVKSLCIANECQCVPHYHINNHLICIKDRGLKEFCQTNDECYWGPEMVNKIECSLGVCSCVAGYVPDHGKICIRYFSSGTVTTVTILPFLTVIMIAVCNKIF